jgi:signal transduction histidine kinase
MVELHGGNIGVYNNPDCGATFWFSLSLAEQD